MDLARVTPVQVVLRKLGRGSRAVAGRLVRAPRKGSVVVIEFSDGMHEYVTTPVKRVLRVAARVGAGMCCLISVLVVWAADTMLYSPWIIYFSILGTHYLVKWRKTKKKTDLIITTLYFAMLALFSVFFALRLVEVVG